MAMKAFPSLQVCGINVTVLCNICYSFIIFLKKYNYFYEKIVITIEWSFN